MRELDVKITVKYYGDHHHHALATSSLIKSIQTKLNEMESHLLTSIKA
jgi:hypothetical protein